MNLRRSVFGAVAPLALFSGFAHAQSSVTLYGLIDTSIQYAHTGGVSTTRLDSGEVNTTSWGVKGVEDLGDGYKVLFKLENGFNVNNGTQAQTNKMFGREAWVGGISKYGAVQIGLNNDEMAWGLIRYSMGDLGHWDWGHASNNYDFFASTRISNSIYYLSPDIHGFKFTALYGRGANGDSTMPRTLGDTAVVSASYNQGPFSIEAIAETQVYAETTTITATTSTHSGNYEFLGASYDFHFVKLGALAVLHRGAGNITASNFSGYTDPNNIYYDVSALFPHVLASNGSVMVSFGQYRLQRSSHGNSSSWGVRYDYHLSPRTGVYAGVAGILNGSEASFTQTGAQQTGIPVSPGKNELALLVGMMHRF